MHTKHRLTLFITLITLTSIIFSSSTTLAKYMIFESQVEAESTGKQSSIHTTKVIGLGMKETNHEHFFTMESKPLVFLTFDDGPTEHTPAILKILKEYDIKSTFFMLNQNIHNLPKVVKMVEQEGHTIGCHGVTHRVELFYKSTTSPAEEMIECSNTIKNVIGSDVQVIRVPFGSIPHLTSEQKNELEQAKFILWDWNVDSQDWNMKSMDKMIQRVLHQVKELKKNVQVPVILFHDKEITVQALPIIIEKLKGLGYSFKAISTQDKPLQFTNRVEGEN